MEIKKLYKHDFQTWIDSQDEYRPVSMLHTSSDDTCGCLMIEWAKDTYGKHADCCAGLDDIRVAPLWGKILYVNLEGFDITDILPSDTWAEVTTFGQVRRAQQSAAKRVYCDE